MGEDGTLYVLGYGLLWSYIPLAPAGPGPLAPAGSGGPRWRCEALAGPLAPKSIDPAWPPQGAPADQVDPGVLRGIRHLAAVPGGGLLLSDGKAGIRFIGPAGDTALADRLRAHARARRDGDATRAQGVLDRLEQERDDPTAPRLRAARAGMAAQAICAGGDPGPDPRERILAQRHVWQVPRTHGLEFGDMAWDPGTDTLLAAQGSEIRSLDPARNSDKVRYAVPSVRSVAGAPAPRPGRRCQSLVVGPDGTITFATAGWDGEALEQIWRLSRQGDLELVAGRTTAQPGTDQAAPASGGTLRVNALAGAPGGALYAVDRERGSVLLLTPESDPWQPGIRCLAEGIPNLVG